MMHACCRRSVRALAETQMTAVLFVDLACDIIAESMPCAEYEMAHRSGDP